MSLSPSTLWCLPVTGDRCLCPPAAGRAVAGVTPARHSDIPLPGSPGDVRAKLLFSLSLQGLRSVTAPPCAHPCPSFTAIRGFGCGTRGAVGLGTSHFSAEGQELGGVEVSFGGPLVSRGGWEGLGPEQGWRGSWGVLSRMGEFGGCCFQRSCLGVQRNPWDLPQCC